MTEHNWEALLKQRFAVSVHLAGDLVAELQETPLPGLSEYVRGRLKAAAFYSVLSYPVDSSHYFRYAMAYFIGWVFGLDELMDNCASMDVLDELQDLLAQQSNADWDFVLPADAAKSSTGVEFTLVQLVNALQPLRRVIAQNAALADGVSVFDESLQEQVVPAMYQEARWRLGLDAQPDYETYLYNSHISICGMISADLTNAFLPDARENRRQADKAINALGYATRLFNDVATRFRDEAEGRANSISLLAAARDIPVAEAAKLVEQQIDDYCTQLEVLCLPNASTDETQPLAFLYDYIFHCGLVSRAMYAQGDFVELMKQTI